MEIALLGCGEMGGVLARALGSSNFLHLFHRDYRRANLLADEVGGRAHDSLEMALRACELAIIAVKPKDAAALMHEVADFLPPKASIATLVAGAALKDLNESFPKHATLLLMPNIASGYGGGVVALSSRCEDLDWRKGISTALDKLGVLYWIEESQMAAFTALAGSGPAFLFEAAEGWVEAGIAMGLSKELASRIVADTIAGSATAWQRSGEHPAQLKWRVCSPGGMTIEGIRVLGAKGFKNGLFEAILAAYWKVRS